MAIVTSSATSLNGGHTPSPTASVPDGPLYPQTLESARAWFEANGVSMTDWCAAHGVKYQTLQDALRGRLDGRRGQGHHCLVELGIKPRPAIPAPART